VLIVYNKTVIINQYENGEMSEKSPEERRLVLVCVMFSPSHFDATWLLADWRTAKFRYNGKT
jgi:hypothetical protein